MAGATAYVPSNGGLAFATVSATRPDGNAGTKWGGENVGGSGGTSNGGATTAVSTVAAPSSGLAVAVEELVDSGGAISMRLALVNFGPDAVSLAEVRLRYFFTLDASTELRFETYYVGFANVSLPITVKGTIGTVDATEANRYLELSFDTGTLMVGTGSAFRLNGSLHDSSWTAQVGSNDYSYVPLVGYCDRITVYQNGRLTWGTEPSVVGEPPYNGVGGASSAGGSTGLETSGGRASAGGAGGASASGGFGTGGTSMGGSLGVSGATNVVIE
jgi:hypothetical protein